MTLIPMTGTDYASRAEVLDAFVRGDHFLDEDTHRPVTRRDVEADDQREVPIRYHGLSRVATLEVTDGTWRAR